MNCRDCIHFKACDEMARANGVEEFNTMYAEKCEDFSDRSLWAKLPCKAGDVVYVIYDGYVTCADVVAFYIDKYGGMFDLLITTKEEYAAGFKKVIDKSYTFSDIFLSREEAERALVERRD